MGHGEMGSNFSFGIDRNGIYYEVNYLSDTMFANLQAYLNALINSGWAVIEMSGSDSAGTLQLATEASQTGQLKTINIDFTTDSWASPTKR